MYELDAHRFVYVINAFRILQRKRQNVAGAAEYLRGVDTQQLYDDLLAMDLRLAALELERLREKPAVVAKTAKWASDTIETVMKLLVDELRDRKFVALSREDQARYAPDSPLFGGLVSTRFPSATYEISEAGKCLALGRSTACVFHLMRTLEMALTAVRKSLKIPTPTTPTWNAVLGPIKAAIPKLIGKAKSRRPFYEELHGTLDTIRAAWRNPTMHVEKVYTESEADFLFRATKLLMEKIASRIDEDGRQKA